MAAVNAARSADRSMWLTVLTRTVKAGNYRVPAEYVADAILAAAAKKEADR